METQPVLNTIYESLIVLTEGKYSKMYDALKAIENDPDSLISLGHYTKTKHLMCSWDLLLEMSETSELQGLYTEYLNADETVSQ